MWKLIIYLYMVSLAMGSSEVREAVGNNSIDLLADLNIEYIPEQTYTNVELEKEISECKARLQQYEASSCLSFRNSSDIHIIRVPDIEPFAVSCEADIEDGGWTVIQRRLDGSVNFERSWNTYRDGFGDLKGEFFIGLEKLHRITKAQPQELYIALETFQFTTFYAWFRFFKIGSEEEGYVLKSLTGTNTDTACSLCLQWNIGSKFTTFDKDNDKYWWGNCAKEFKGGWWYGSCEKDFNDYSKSVRK